MRLSSLRTTIGSNFFKIAYKQGLIYYHFKQILSIISNYSQDTIYKSLTHFKTMMQKELKFSLGILHNGLASELTFVLLPVKKSSIQEKKYHKKDIILTLSFSHSQIVFALLAEIITLFMGFIYIYVWKSRFQKLFSKAFLKQNNNNRSSSVKDHLEDLLEIIFRVLQHQKKSCRGRKTQSSKRSQKNKNFRRINKLLKTRERSEEIVYFFEAIMTPKD